MTRNPWLVLVLLLWAPGLAAQGVTGTLVVTVSDAQGGVLPGAAVHLRSAAQIGGTSTVTTNEKGQLRFPALPPGSYILDVELSGFATLHEEGIPIGPGATIERSITLKVAGVAESIVVQTAGSRIEARNPGFGTHFGAEDLKSIPTRRASMFDFIRIAPGISPTSPSSGTTTTVSSFGSGTNENQFLVDGVNFTCPCNGVARAEAGVDFIQEVQVHGVGASPEFGNVQGAVINIVLRQGANRFLSDAAFYAQADALTSQPAHLPIATGSPVETGYTRVKYNDFTTTVGGPIRQDRLWFIGGYQYLRDYDSQPGTLDTFPRETNSDKIFGKLTWQLAPGWQLVQSFHDELQNDQDQSTIARPFETTLRRQGSVPATTFGHLTHTSSNTVWDLLAGRFVYGIENAPSTGNRTTVSHVNNNTDFSGGPPSFGSITIQRTTAKATVSHYRIGWLGADHELKAGTQFEQAGHHSINVIPTGVRFAERNGAPSQRISADPSSAGGQFFTASAFVTDALAVGNRLTINAGVRFDHNRAISQDLPGADFEGHETDTVVPGLGTMYTWNLWSPRVGVAAKLTSDGRTMLRASYGRFSQGVLTGELEPFHPGAAVTTTNGFNPTTGQYSTLVSVVSPLDLRINPEIRAPHTDDYSISVDREIGTRISISAAYVRKDGADFIGWTDIGGQYVETTTVLAPSDLLPDGRTVSRFTLTNTPNDRRYLLTNPDEYFLTYNGLAAVVEKRRANGWQALASYTFSRVEGLQASGGATASGAQVSTVSPPQPITFGRDPNDLVNAIGRLPNDRPHMFRAMGSVDLLRTGFVVAANLQYLSGKPWAATATTINPQDARSRVLLEPRGTRRLSAQTLLDLRVSRSVPIGRMGRVDLILDVLNALNDDAEESIRGDDVLSPATFGQPTTFIDPRRVMLGVRMNLGR